MVSKERENDVNDKKHLHPGEVWIHWGSTGTDLALVATESPVLGVTCTRFVRAARGDEPEQSVHSDGEWTPIEDYQAEGEHTKLYVDVIRQGIRVGISHNLYGGGYYYMLPDDIRLCRRTEKPAATVPDISDEERQVVELVRLARQWKPGEHHPAESWIDLGNLRFFAGRWRVSRIGLGLVGDGVTDYVRLPDAITELRSRLAPPQRPTEQEWFEAWNLPTGKERTSALARLSWRHEVAAVWHAAGGEPPQRPTQERTIAAIRAFLEVAESQDIEEQDELQRVLDDWDKAQGGEQ